MSGVTPEYQKAEDERMDALIKASGVPFVKSMATMELEMDNQRLRAENERLRGALDSAGDVIASVVACCTYGSEAQAKAGAYGISHEAFTKIDQFIRKYSDILNTLDGVEPSIYDGSKQDFNNPDFNNH